METKIGVFLCNCGGAINNIDFDAGSIISGRDSIQSLGEKLLDYIIDVASGRITPAAARLDQDDFIFWKRGVSL